MKNPTENLTKIAIINYTSPEMLIVCESNDANNLNIFKIDSYIFALVYICI